MTRVLRRIKPSICEGIYSRFSSPCPYSTRAFHPALTISSVGAAVEVPLRDLPSNHQQPPSVTWGFLLGQKEKMASNAIICSYLKGLGIVTDELETLEMPSTLDVMKERVEFLRNIGLTIDDMNGYPLMLGCSVRKNMIPVLLYMEEKVGIPRSELANFVKSYPQLLHSSVIHDIFPVVQFLKGLDVGHYTIKFVIQKYPQLLGLRVEGTPSTTVGYLVGIGVSTREMKHMVLNFPYFLGMRVGTVIKPLVDYLVSLGLPQMLIARILEKRPKIMACDLEGVVRANVGHLVSFGVKREMIPSVIAQYPPIIGFSLKRNLCSQQYFFALKLSIDPQGFACMVERMPQILILHQSIMMERIQFLMDRELSSQDIARMVVACPQILIQPVWSMKRAFYFFKTEIKKPLIDLINFPHYFTYSLEGRIKPRFEVLWRSRLMRASLGWFLNCSDLKFKERMKMGQCGEMESAGPWFCMGGKLEVPNIEIVSDDGESSEVDETVAYRKAVTL